MSEIVSLKRGNLVELDIVDLAFGGKGIARVETVNGQFVVFVQNTVPGQRVLGRVIKKRKKFAECKLKEILNPSPEEVEIPYQSIPGAPYARWPIARQHEEKKRTTIELFKRIGQFPEVEEIVDEFIQSPNNWHYRNKMEYSFTNRIFDLDLNDEREGFALGFKHRGQWWSVENLDQDSGLFDEQLESGLHKLRAFCEGTSLQAWNPMKREGFFRFLTVRKSFTTNELLVNLTTTSHGLDAFNLEDFVEQLKQLIGDRLAGLLHTINDNTGDVSHHDESETKLIYGKDKLDQELLGLNFEMSIKSFFQPNPQTAALLYSKAIDYALVGKDQGADEVVMDLFCGTGTIGQILAKKSLGKKKIIGVDIVEEAIEDAKKNAARNELEGLEFYAADVGKFLLQYPQYKGKINTIVLDPPRGGIAPKTLRRTIELEANRIVYVSCNPATQARDLIELREAGYIPKKITLVDQFPHTSHIETVLLLEK